MDFSLEIHIFFVWEKNVNRLREFCMPIEGGFSCSATHPFSSPLRGREDAFRFAAARASGGLRFFLWFTYGGLSFGLRILIFSGAECKSGTRGDGGFVIWCFPSAALSVGDKPPTLIWFLFGSKCMQNQQFHQIFFLLFSKENGIRNDNFHLSSVL